ncbi:hypothetical protein HDU97_000402 [Phlyctochytrium planicorne]|nr:hypothetical protein HDU97_000402 [Phlyctochytrium planicorne]
MDNPNDKPLQTELLADGPAVAESTGVASPESPETTAANRPSLAGSNSSKKLTQPVEKIREVDPSKTTPRNPEPVSDNETKPRNEKSEANSTKVDQKATSVTAVTMRLDDEAKTKSNEAPVKGQAVEPESSAGTREKGIIASIDHYGSTDYETDAEKKGINAFTTKLTILGKPNHKLSKISKPDEDDSFQVAMIKMVAADRADRVDAENKPGKGKSFPQHISRRGRKEDYSMVDEEDDGYNTAVPSGSFSPSNRSQPGSDFETVDDRRQRIKRKHREDDIFKNKTHASKFDGTRLRSSKSKKKEPEMLKDVSEKSYTDDTTSEGLKQQGVSRGAEVKSKREPSAKPVAGVVDSDLSKLEAENQFLKKHLQGLQSNSKEVWGNEAALTEKIRCLEEQVEQERKDRETLDDENKELKGKIAALKRQVLKEANRAAIIPKMIPNRIPASVEANINLRHQFHRRITQERENYARLEEENKELVAKIKTLELQLTRKSIQQDPRSSHRLNEILFWKKKMREVELEKAKIEDTLSLITRQLEKRDMERERLIRDLENTRALLSQHLTTKQDMATMKALESIIDDHGNRYTGPNDTKKAARAKTTSRTQLSDLTSKPQSTNLKDSRVRGSSMPPLRDSRARTSDLTESLEMLQTDQLPSLPHSNGGMLNPTREGRSRSRSKENGDHQSSEQQPFEESFEEDRGSPIPARRELSSRELFSASQVGRKRGNETLHPTNQKKNGKSKAPNAKVERAQVHEEKKFKGSKASKASEKKHGKKDTGRKRVISLEARRRKDEDLPGLPKEKNLVMDSDNEERPLRFAFRDSSMSMHYVPGSQSQPIVPKAQNTDGSSRDQMATLHEDEDRDRDEGDQTPGGDRMRAARTQLEYNIYVASKKAAEVDV